MPSHSYTYRHTRRAIQPTGQRDRRAARPYPSRATTTTPSGHDGAEEGPGLRCACLVGQQAVPRPVQGDGVGGGGGGV